MQYGENAVRSMNLSKPGQPMGLLEMMVRGAFLDARVYRMAALDANGNQNAVMALALTFLAASVGAYLLSLSVPGIYGIMMMIGMVVVQVVALVVAVGVMAALSQQIVQVKLNFGQILRAMAYAQSPGVLSIVPVLGPLLSLWRLPTSLVAIREISAAEGGKAAILLIVGAAASAVAAAVLAPVILAAFSFMG